MEFLAEYGLFLAEAVTMLVVVMILVGSIVGLTSRAKKHEKGHIEVHRLNEETEMMGKALEAAMLDAAAQKKLKKEYKKAEKAKAKQAKQAAGGAPARKRLFLLDFKGDIRASAVEHLREEITAVLSQATTADEVVVRLESSGGMVHSYGLASSQLDRISKKGIPLTVCVDKVAASGGYMMACVADKILAAPFSIMGSIGVVAQLPNFHRLLKKHDIDFEVMTAGEYKRTLTVFGENTDRDREKFTEDLEETHGLFKDFVQQHRPAVDISRIATGEIWLGTRAKDLLLVDELMTSDEYLIDQMAEADIFQVSYIHKKTLQERVGLAAEGSVDRLLLTWWGRLRGSNYYQ